MQKSSDSMYSSIFMLENICYHNFTWIGPNFQKILNFVSIIGPREPKLNSKFNNSTRTKFKISYEFSILQVKWWYHLFSGIKMEEFMESEHSGFFRVELVTKNVVPGSSGTHFMHMRVILSCFPFSSSLLSVSCGKV